MKMPKGRRPKHISEVLKMYPDSEVLLVCPTCGKWVKWVDHFFPYHVELNECATCGRFMDQRVFKR